MEEKMMVCVGCGHEEMGAEGAKCSMCGGDMKLKEENAEMGGADVAGDAMPAEEMPAEKPME